MTPRLLAPVALLLGACAPDIGGDTDSGTPDTSDTPPTDSATDTASGGEPVETEVDARDYESWVSMNLWTGSVVDVTAPEADDTWDIAFQRFSVKLNGGVSGAGGVEAAWVEGADYATHTEVPVEGWITDAADDDEDGVPEYALEAWYDYDENTHVLTPKAGIYVIRSVEGTPFKFAIDSYYDDAGTSGFMAVRWASLASD